MIPIRDLFEVGSKPAPFENQIPKGAALGLCHPRCVRAR